MSGQNPSFQTGPRTYEAVSAVKGGQVVQADLTPTASGEPGMAPAAAASALVVGVAFKDCVPASAQEGFASGDTAYTGGFPFTDISVPDEFSAVYHDCMVKVTYAAAATYRQPLIAAANGQVTPAAGDGTQDGIRIGWCAQVGGVAAGAVGLARILV